MRSKADEFVDQPALLTAFLRMSSGCGQVACMAMFGVYDYVWRERIDSIAEGSTRILKD